MKKELHFILSNIIWLVSLYSANAQTPLAVPDSILTASFSIHMSAQASSLQKQPVTNLMSRRIPVKAGDSIRVSAMVLDNRPYKGRFWKGLAKAVVPSFILSNLVSGKTVISGDQPLNKATIPTFGAGLAVIPSAIELAQKQIRSKTFVGLSALDTNGHQVALLTDFMTKAARKDWQELHVGYRIAQDGFIDIIGKTDGKAGLSFTKFGTDKWLQVVKYSKSETKAHTEIDTTLNKNQSPSSARIGTGGESAPQARGSSCTAWYWCDGFGCTFIGTSCQDDIDYGEISNGGGGGEGPDPIFGLNSCEWSYLLTHPSVGPALSGNKTLVEDWLDANGMGVGNTDGDSPYNAIKHALYQALNVCDVGKLNTQEMAARHEECNGVLPSTQASKVMDTHNNSIGMDLPTLVGCGFANLTQGVINLFNGGYLHKINGQPTP